MPYIRFLSIIFPSHVCYLINSRSCIPYHQQLLRVTPDGSWNVTPIAGSLTGAPSGPISPRGHGGSSYGPASPRGVYPPLSPSPNGKSNGAVVIGITSH
jgi:hypothetical protein